LAGILFGQSDGRTIGSSAPRVRAFLAAVGSRGFVPTPIAEFSDARAIDRGLGTAATPIERIADAGTGPARYSTQVEGTPALPASRVAAGRQPAVATGTDSPLLAAGQALLGGPEADTEPLSESSLAAWARWLTPAGSEGPDFLAAAGGVALMILGLRVVLGGRRPVGHDDFR
jgi:hypothetical protein